MTSTRLYMSMSLDGFVTGPNVGPGNGLGDGGERLHHWILPDGGDDIEAAVARLTGANRRIYDEFMSTGAVIAGRGTFEAAGGWQGDHHDGVPVYILSRHPAPDWVSGWPGVHYVSDLEVAVLAAKEAAGDKDVMVHGASTITRMAIAGGLLDEIEIHLVPILLGEGRRLFDHLGVAPHELERVRVLEGDDGVTHLRFRVRR
jgi:dihydrofolate reductase